jgi:uncharacterized membrane protein
MFVGIISDQLYRVIGVTNPLSPGVLSITVFVTVGAFSALVAAVTHARGTSSGPSSGFTGVRPGEAGVAVLLVSIPAMALLGTLLHSSLLLVFVVAIASILILCALFFEVSVELSSLMLYMVALALILQTLFISRYLVGYDVFTELYVFNSIKSSASWLPPTAFVDLQTQTYAAMLSVTVLPITYSALLNVGGDWVLMIAYPLIYALVPVALYEAYRRRFGTGVGLLSAFYFILLPRFYETSSRRQWIGELFLVLSILVMLDPDMALRKKSIMVIIFGLSLAVSHYALSYLYLFCLGVMLIYFVLVKGRTRALTGLVFVFLLVATLSWYSFVSAAPELALIGLWKNALGSLVTDFLRPGSGGYIYESLSLQNFSLLQQADRVISKIPYVCILVGMFLLFRTRGKKGAFSDDLYISLATAGFGIFAMAILIPRLAMGFIEDRLYHVTTIILGPVVILGAMSIIEWVHRVLRSRPMAFLPKRSAYRQAVCVLLIAIFLFKVGLVYEVAGEVVPVSSVSISFERMKASQNDTIMATFYDGYFPDQDVYGVLWLSRSRDSNSSVLADLTSLDDVLRAYGNLEYSERETARHTLGNNTVLKSNVYVYLRYLNVRGLFVTGKRLEYSTNMTSHLLSCANLVYSNGGSQVLRSLDGKGSCVFAANAVTPGQATGQDYASKSEDAGGLCVAPSSNLGLGICGRTVLSVYRKYGAW